VIERIEGRARDVALEDPMSEASRGLTHLDADKKNDDVLKQEARAYLAKTASAQLTAELLLKLRDLSLPWWKPDKLRSYWPAADRMRWIELRTDLRQQITTSLTGLAPKAARKKSPEFQASLIDAVIDEGDIGVDRFEESFEPCDLAVYGPAPVLWRTFRDQMPWDEETQVHIDLTAWLLRALVADKSSIEGCSRRPVLSAWDVRTAIDGKIWHSRMPLDVRVAIDEARLQQEKASPGQPFHAQHDLAIAVPELIAANIPLRELVKVLARAEKAMGFEPPPPPVSVGEAPTIQGQVPRSILEASKPPAGGDGAKLASDGSRPSEPPRVDAVRGSEQEAAARAVVAPGPGSVRPVPMSRDSAQPPRPSSPPMTPFAVPLPASRATKGGDGSPSSVAPGSVRPSTNEPFPKAGEGASGSATREPSTRPITSAPPLSNRPGRSMSEIPGAPRPPIPPAAITREVMPKSSLLEDDDLEATNPWMVPTDAELVVLDSETTSQGEPRLPSGEATTVDPAPRKRGRHHKS
jgi:hypothetical protein